MAHAFLPAASAFEPTYGYLSRHYGDLATNRRGAMKSWRSSLRGETTRTLEAKIPLPYKDRQANALFGDVFPLFFQQFRVFSRGVERERKLRLGQDGVGFGISPARIGIVSVAKI